MNTVPPFVMQWADWFDLFKHFLAYSLMSVGGPFGLLPEMHRYLVIEHQWLTDAQFSASVVLGQAAPGPNILFIALIFFLLALIAEGLLPGIITTHVGFFTVITFIFISTGYLL